MNGDPEHLIELARLVLACAVALAVVGGLIVRYAVRPMVMAVVASERDGNDARAVAALECRVARLERQQAAHAAGRAAT